MATQVLCDHFKKEQYVRVTQVRTILSVYVATRQERIANKGLGCFVKDLVLGESLPLKLSELAKMSLRFPNGARVKTIKLREGVTYTMIGVPKVRDYGVFIVPNGNHYEYVYQGRFLKPGECVLFDGKTTRIISYSVFRKLFVMQPNAVSSGKLRSGSARFSKTSMQAQQQQDTATKAFGFTQFQSNRGVQKQQVNQKLHSTIPMKNNFDKKQANVQLNNMNLTKYRPLGRILHNGTLVGLILYDGIRQQNVPLKQCMAYAEKGEIQNVKLVRRNDTYFLSGYGMSLESLPYIQR